MAAYTTKNGAPLNGEGADGDMVIDYAGRFLWGPKGNVTPGSWAGTANSIVGPTGPIGPQGQQPTAMGVGAGPSAGIYTAVTLSSTPTVMYQANSTTAVSTFVAGANNFFTGALLSSTTGGGTFELWNQTAGASVYKSAAVAANSSAIVGQFNNFTYPLVSGNTYVWRVTGTASFTGVVTPYYYQALPGPAPSGGVVSVHPSFQHIGAINSSTASNMNAVGDTVLLNYASNRNATLYNVTVSSAAGGSGSAIFYLQNLSANTTTYIVQDIAGTQLSLLPGQTLTTPYLGISLPSPNYQQWRVYGSGMGTYTVTMQIAQ